MKTLRHTKEDVRELGLDQSSLLTEFEKAEEKSVL